MVYLKDFISENRILIINPASRMEALTEMIEKSSDNTLIRDFDGFRNAVFSRESIVSTGIGQNVAIPHVKTDTVKQFFITVGIFPEGVEWDSLDAKPVKIAFLIGGPDNHEKYLQILAKLTLIIRNAKKRAELTAARTPSEVAACFSGL